MKKFSLPLAMVAFALVIDGASATEVMSPTAGIQSEIEHTKRTLVLLEGYFAEHPNDTQDIVIDFQHRGVCEVDSMFTLHYSKVIDELRKESRAQTKAKPIIIRLSENYLEAPSIDQIVTFILSEGYIKDNLVALDLSNNRLRKAGLFPLRRLVEQCPNLSKLNVSINYISAAEFEEVFGTIDADKKSKVTFSVY